MTENAESKRPLIPLLKDLYLTRTGLVILITMGLAGVTFWISAKTHDHTSEFWLALGAGILASAVFSFLSVLFTSTQFDKILRTTIEEEIERDINHIGNSLINKFGGDRILYFPTRTYPATNDPDPRFNNDVNEALNRSERYLFQGLTGKHSFARIASIKKPLEEIRMIIADPSQPDSAVTRLQQEIELKGGSAEQIRAEVVA